MSHEHREKSPEEIADDIAQLDFYAHRDKVRSVSMMIAAIDAATPAIQDLKVSCEPCVYRLRRDNITLTLRTSGPRVKGEGHSMNHDDQQAPLSCNTITWYVDDPDSLRQLILAWLS